MSEQYNGIIGESVRMKEVDCIFSIAFSRDVQRILFKTSLVLVPANLYSVKIPTFSLFYKASYQL